MWVEKGKLTKKALANIIELTGAMPEVGEMLLCTKDGNQMEMDAARPEIFNVLYNAMDAEKELEDTGITICERRTHRILQSPATREIKRIREDVFGIISSRGLEEDEDNPEGPMLGAYGGIYWINNHMAFMLMPTEDDSKKRIINYLERISINEYRKLEIPKTKIEEEEEEA